MSAVHTTTDRKRVDAMRAILNRARNQALLRVRELREKQDQDVSPPPSDELDVARSLAEVETHASIIERAEFQLKAIDGAYNRLERGRYGICEDCYEEIPIQRLSALPFASCCVDCQRKRNHRIRAVGEGRVDEPSGRLWTIPEEMDESLEKQDALTGPEEELIVRDEEPFGPEVGEFEQLPPSPTARRRGRPRKRETQET